MKWHYQSRGRTGPGRHVLRFVFSYCFSSMVEQQKRQKAATVDGGGASVSGQGVGSLE